MKLKDKITIIITLHNRKKHINSMIEYYSDLDCDIVVLDSSTEETEINNIDRVEYVFEPNKFYYNKIYDKLCEIKTPYVIELPDDDIVFKESIFHCVEFLDNNQDYSVVDGLFLNGKGGVGTTLSFREFGYTGVFRSHHFNDNKIGDIKNRLLFNMTKFYKAHNHSIIRTDYLKEVFGFVIDNEELQPVEYFDRILGFILLILGNYKPLNIPFMIRRVDDKIIKTSKEYPKKLKRDVSYWTITNGNKLNSLANYLSNKSGLPIDECVELTYNCFKNIKINAGYNKGLNYKSLCDSKYFKGLKINGL